jgi:hypothetical protein
MAHARVHGMVRAVLALGLGLGTAAWAGKTAETPPRWQYAGENQGIRFQFRISDECRPSGAHLDLKLENTLDHAVTVSFRIVDPDWKQSFERELEANGKDEAIRFTPDEGTACHPYVDEVYVESRATQVTHSGTDRDEVSP